MSPFTIASDFWQQQAFASLETYSFNRGPKSAAEYERLSQEITAARQELATGRYMQLAKLSHRLRELEREMSGGAYNVLLTNPVIPSFSIRRIAILALDAAATRQLAAILREAIQQEGFAACSPVYRDALVFRDAQGQGIRVLNICFECLLMSTDDKQLVEADFATYDALRDLLMELGHPIEPR